MARRAALALAFVLCTTLAHAAGEVRLWQRLDAVALAELGRQVADYNRMQREFRVRLLPLAGTSGLQRLALPLDIARPVLYYNGDALRRAHLDPRALPGRWYDMPRILAVLAEGGCAYTSAWPAWVLVESAGGAPDASLMVRWTAMLATWEKAGYFSYSASGGDAEARFVRGECALLSSSSASRAALAGAARFAVGVAPLPSYGDARQAAVPGTESAVWIERPSTGVANFCAFLAARAAAAQRSREAIERELDAVWRGEKTAVDALQELERLSPPLSP